MRPDFDLFSLKLCLIMLYHTRQCLNSGVLPNGRQNLRSNQPTNTQISAHGALYPTCGHRRWLCPCAAPACPSRAPRPPGLVTPCTLAQDGARPAELSLQAAPAGRSGTDHFHLLLNKHCKCFLSVFGNGSHNCFLCAEGTGQLQPQGRAQRDSGTETAPARAPAAQGLSPAHESQNQPSS